MRKSPRWHRLGAADFFVAITVHIDDRAGVIGIMLLTLESHAREALQLGEAIAAELRWSHRLRGAWDHCIYNLARWPASCRPVELGHAAASRIYSDGLSTLNVAIGDEPQAGLTLRAVVSDLCLGRRVAVVARDPREGRGPPHLGQWPLDHRSRNVRLQL